MEPRTPHLTFSSSNNQPDFAGDVTDKEFVGSAVSKTAETFGGLHYAFDNAGIEQVLSALTDQTVADATD